MSPNRVLRRGLPLLALAAVVLALPHAGAAWTEEYGKLDDLGVTFRGLACHPTATETSSDRSPRADIMGAENLNNGGDGFLVEVKGYEFRGERNERKDPQAVLGNPRQEFLIAEGDYDGEDVVSLGQGGWFRAKLGSSVQNSAGADLAVYEADRTMDSSFKDEPFCVFGARDEGGPFTFIGVHDAAGDTDDEPGGAFDLSTYYALLKGVMPVNHIIVMDSDTAAPFIDVSLAASAASASSLEEVTFTDGTDLAGFEGVTRAWSVDGEAVPDDDASTPATLTYAFPKYGEPEVCLDVSATLTVEGEAIPVTGSACVTVEVGNQPPVAVLEADPPSPGIGAAVTLDASKSVDPEGQPMRYSWDLGDGTTRAASPSPLLQHRFEAKGIYTVTVTVTDDQGETATASLAVPTENEAPVAALEVRDYTQTRANDITFDASGSFDPDGDRLTYVWDFGDDTPVVEGTGKAVVKHAYAVLSETDPATGAKIPYVVTLTVRDEFQGEDEATTDILILYEPPVADFSGPTGVLSLEEATYTDTSVAGTNALDDSKRTWTIGSAAPVVGGEASITHTFARPGEVQITLRVEDTNGGYGVKTQTVTVENRPPVVDASKLSLPTATRVPTVFQAEVSDADGEVVSWLWDFGDGTRSSDPEPRHAYAATGVYPLTLTVTDDLGARTTWRPAPLAVDNEAPTAQMTVFGDPDDPRTVRFQDASSDDGEVVSWAWFFDDGDGDPTVPDAITAEATHTFPDAAGTYRVRYVVADDDGVEWSIVRYVRPGQLAAGGDGDGDGVLDGIDNCPEDPNPDQRDADEDGVGDACTDLADDPDGDADGDGVPNALDAFPFDASEDADTDGDGVGDNADPDDDGDGIPDDEEVILGTDPLAADSDGDGVSDADELAAGTDPLAAPPEPAPDPEPVQEVVEPERSLVWVWVLLGLFGAAGAAAGTVLVLRRRRGADVQWRKPEF